MARKRERITDSKLVSIIENEITSSHDYNTKISKERRTCAEVL